MKCTNKLYTTFILLLCIFSLSGCSVVKYNMPYDPDTIPESMNFDLGDTDSVYTGFASNLCVVNDDVLNTGDMAPGATAEALFDIDNKETVIAKNANLKLPPASLTKVMTALLAIKYGHMDDVITASANVKITESGAQTMKLNEGDRMTLRDALYGLLLYSANDCGVMVAEYVSGSVEEFANLMNKTALELGATNTHFTNPHGLSDDDHYTTAYDLYLIFNEALKYDDFVKIISTSEYTCNYKNRDGDEKKFDFTSTNAFLNGKVVPPPNVTVVGGKTGTTNAAGSCLILLSYDSSQKPYISVILNDLDHDIMYSDMTNILMQIP